MKIYEILKENNKEDMPAKMDSFLEPFPKVPQGVKTKSGGVKFSDDRGEFVWDSQGNPLKYTSPNFNGSYQVHDMQTGNFVAHLTRGGFSSEQEYDKNGNAIGDSGGSFNAGPVSVTRNRKGDKSATYTMGDQETTWSQKSVKDRWGNPVKDRSGEVVGSSWTTKTRMTNGS